MNRNRQIYYNALLGAIGGLMAWQVVGLFDKSYGEAFGIIAGNDPVFRCLTSVGMARGNTLLIGGTTYTVVSIEADGTGIDLCRLEAA